MSITNNAMVANLQMGVWSGHRLDKEASRKVTEDAGAANDAARVNKHLIPKEALKEIVTASGAVRQHFYTKTLPWKDNGDRLLTRKMYASFNAEHNRLVEEFDAAVNNFINHTYPDTVQRAEFRMGELFDRNDYPSQAELRHKFYSNLDIDAVTAAGDFRVGLDDAEVAAVRADMEKAMEARLGKAMQDLWGRLATTLGHFAATMNETDKTFRNTTVSNLKEIIDILPALNVLDDPELERIRSDLDKLINGVEPDDLRKHPAQRKQIAGEAQTILNDMSGFLKAFGGAP